MKTAILALACVVGAFAQAPSPPPVSSPATSADATSTPIVHDGQTYQLANRTAAKNVETDEYVLAGEKIADWTQLLTVQRITLPKPAGTDDFLAYFQKRVADDGATLDVLKQSKAASVFAVRFPRSERNDEQVMICLAFVDVTNPALLNIVQYAIKPTRSDLAVVELRIRSWRDRFLRQAQGLNP